MVVPSGDHAEPLTEVKRPSSFWLTSTRSAPVATTRRMTWVRKSLSLRSMKRENAIVVPSGDQVGPLSLPPLGGVENAVAPTMMWSPLT